jgi:hypothetical protein
MQVITRHRTDSEIYEASFLPNYGVLDTETRMHAVKI